MQPGKCMAGDAGTADYHRAEGGYAAKSDAVKMRIIGRNLPISHFLGHMENELAILFLDLAQEAKQLVQIASFFPDAAPGDVVRRLALGQIGKLRWLFSIVEELVEWALEGARQFLQRLDSRNSVAILYTGNITAKQASSLFDVALREFPFLAHFAEAVANNHGALLHPRMDRASTWNERAWFFTREEAEKFAAGPSNTVYHGDIAHQCAKCGFYHLSRPEWLEPTFTPADLQMLEDAGIETRPRLDEHFRCCICGSVMRDGIEFLIIRDGSVRCTQVCSQIPEA